jgi:sugar phosphate isomerase/epimerase
MNKISQTVPYQSDTIFSPFKAADFENALSSLAQSGFTGVEIAVANPMDVNAKILAELVGKYGLSITTISTGQAYGIYGVCMSSFDVATRAKSVEFVKEYVDLSVEIGHPPVTIGLLRGKLETGDPRSLLDNFKCTLVPCVDYAMQTGVRLQIAPINNSETTLLNDTFEVLNFLDEIGNPENVGILYDTYHSYLEDGDMISAVRAAAGKIMNVHLADSHRGLPGYGNIDFKSTYGAIRETGYTGAYALETQSIPSEEFVKEHCFESVAKILF